jgi:hypothetical protein
MTGDININFGDTLPYLEQKFLGLFGRDAATQELKEWFRKVQTTAIQLTQNIQCVGMRRPVPFESIYQPTHLRLTAMAERFEGEDVRPHEYANRTARSILAEKAMEEQAVTVEEFLKQDEDAIIFAGPGWGKTTFLHHIFRSTLRDPDFLPVLITLRRPFAIDHLQRYVGETTNIKRTERRACTLLLVDGYDEITKEQRRQVSEALLQYQASRVGKFYLSCREYYDVFDLKAAEVRIDRFNQTDKYRFVKAFLSAFQSQLEAVAVVKELEERGFGEFLSHPLLLTLACIVKTSSVTSQPRSALRLLERAIDVLCYRWDEKKGLSREAVTPLDGKDRIQILRKIAHIAKSPFIPKSRAEFLAGKELDRMTFDNIDSRQVLLECAKFYGILVPRDEGWEFTHRTIHDFLGAQYWVETGEFAKAKSYEWNARTGYAACLMHDATSIFEAALAAPDGLPTVTEIIGNSPNFDMKRAPIAVINYFSNPERVRHYESLPDRISGTLSTDFVRRGTSRFLNYVIEACAGKRGQPAADVVAAYCLVEMYQRGLKLDFQTYDGILPIYKSERFTFVVIGKGQVQLGFLNPHASQII